jgi:hypothetical protein
VNLLQFFYMKGHPTMEVIRRECCTLLPENCSAQVFVKTISRGILVIEVSDKDHASYLYDTVIAAEKIDLISCNLVISANGGVLRNNDELLTSYGIHHGSSLECRLSHLGGSCCGNCYLLSRACCLKMYLVVMNFC